MKKSFKDNFCKNKFRTCA